MSDEYTDDEIRDMGLATSGDKVRFLERNGYEFELNRAKDMFIRGEILTVSHVDVGDWSSRYHFDGIKGSWNTVMFERIDT